MTTVEGIINRAVAGLEQDQPARREQHLDVAQQIDQFIDTLNELKNVDKPFTLVSYNQLIKLANINKPKHSQILEDITGNSFIENPNAPKTDCNCTYEYFKRSKEQDHELGIFTHTEVIDEEEEPALLHPIKEGEFTLEDIEGEVMQFPTNCPNCGTFCQTNMKMTSILYCC